MLNIVLAVSFFAASPEATLAGTFWFASSDYYAGPPAVWREDLDAIEGLGMRVMVLGGVAGTGAQAGSMDAFFAEADRRGLELYLDTGQTANWWVSADPVPELERAKRQIRFLAEAYGGHSSFKGWYIPYELYVFWDSQAELIRRLYGEVSAACKEAAPGKPVLISPFFILDKAGQLGDFRYAAPEEYRDFWTGLLKASRIDIVALQDSGEHLSCYTIEERGPFFDAMKAACDAAGARLWANIETGELDVESVDAYVRRFGLKTHVNDPKTAGAWRGVPAGKLASKLRFAGRYTGTAITWGFQEFARKDRQLYESYKQILGKN